VLTTPKFTQRKLGDVGERPVVRSELPRQPALPPGVAACLGDRLRAYYAHLMNDPVPDSFIRILEAMDGTRSANNDR
jgi:hypothetical protein